MDGRGLSTAPSFVFRDSNDDSPKSNHENNLELEMKYLDPADPATATTPHNLKLVLRRVPQKSNLPSSSTNIQHVI